MATITVNSPLESATTLTALLAATRRAARGKRRGPRAQDEVAAFLMDAEWRCLELQRRLRLPMSHGDSWHPSDSRTFSIRDPKPRLITAVPFPDRVVHHALARAIEPVLERAAIADSFACRVGRGQHRALRRAQQFSRRWPWVLKMDVSSYFASIPHEPLVALLKRRVGANGVLDHIERIVRVCGTDGRGLPIGSLTSQHLANLYLGVLDHRVKDEWGVKGYLRYMDDFLLFGEREQLMTYRRNVVGVLQDLGLQPNERHSSLVRTRTGVPFLGFMVFPKVIRVRQCTWRRFRMRYRQIGADLKRGRVDEDEAAACMSSLFAHLQAFDTWRLRRSFLSVSK
ncbi:MAG: RNA-dependent DNA polymerase [Rhodobacterales bacterium]|nr:RNA-dependent DNA polymerase [Rhodobacterales bacterium]